MELLLDRIFNSFAAVCSLAVAILMTAQESYGFAALLLGLGALNALIAFRR